MRPARPRRRRLPAAALLAVLAAALPAAPAAPADAQAPPARPAYDADQITDILRPRTDGGDGAAADGMPMPRTRGLKAGVGPAGEPSAALPPPGEAGSGVLPDLKLLFAYGSDELTPEARAQLDELASALGRDELRAYRFAIAGHTDTVGGDGYNEALSRRRAVSVVSYLAREHGIAAERLAAVGYGETQLADPEDPTSGRNRRVEVRTLKEP